MTRFLITALIETPTVHGINIPFAVEAPTSKNAKCLIEQHVKATISGTVTRFDRACNIANLNLSRYRYKTWEYVNFSAEALEEMATDGYRS